MLCLIYLNFLLSILELFCCKPFLVYVFSLIFPFNVDGYVWSSYLLTDCNRIVLHSKLDSFSSFAFFYLSFFPTMFSLHQQDVKSRIFKLYLYRNNSCYVVQELPRKPLLIAFSTVRWLIISSSTTCNHKNLIPI